MSSGSGTLGDLWDEGKETASVSGAAALVLGTGTDHDLALSIMAPTTNHFIVLRHRAPPPGSSSSVKANFFFVGLASSLRYHGGGGTSTRTNTQQRWRRRCISGSTELSM